MSDMNRSFAGQMPELYDRFLVPVMFEPFAQDLANRLQGVLSGHVLELAAGTGIVTRALARTLPAPVAITATDLNPAMLAPSFTTGACQRRPPLGNIFGTSIEEVRFAQDSSLEGARFEPSVPAG